MQQPPASLGPGRVLKGSRRVLGRLKAHPVTKPLAAPLQAAHDAVKKANLAEIEADDADQDAGGEVDVCDVQARETLTDFQLQLVAQVRRNYKAPEYIAFFPDGFEEVKRRSGAELVLVLKGILDRLATLPKDSPLQAFHKPLQAAVDAYTKPLAHAQASAAALVQAETAVDVAVAHWRLAYDSTYGKVRAALAGRRKFAETFFIRWSVPKKTKA